MFKSYSEPMHTEEQNYQELTNRIRTILRDLRRDRDLSQQDFGERIGGLSRFTVMRLEAGSTELRLEQAQAVERATGDDRLVGLVEARDRLGDLRRGAPERDRGVRDLIERSALHRLVVCLLDDLKLHNLLDGQELLSEADVVVVVPTRGRERELFDDQPLLGHVENEISRLGDLSPMPASLTIVESKRLLQPSIIVRRVTGDECATWPLMPVRSRVSGETLPITPSSDPAVVEQLQAHIDWVTEPEVAKPVHVNDTLGVLETARSADQQGTLRFVGYVHHGDEDADRSNPDVGNLVSFLVLYGVMTRDGFPPRRRFVLYERRNVKYDVGRWSLVSSHVQDRDIRRSLKAESDTSWRGVLEPDEAAMRDSVLLEPEDFVLDDRPFKEAAARELQARFGPVFDRDSVVPRLTELLVPARAARIEKHGRNDTHQLRRPIFPRVFALELRGPEWANEHDARNGATAQVNEPKLVQHSSVRTHAFGLDDLRTPDRDRLNDFLVTAGRDGWLIDALKALDIASK